MYQKIITNKYFHIFIIILSYLYLDILLRLFSLTENNFYAIYNLAPLLFSLTIILFNYLIIHILPKPLGLIYYFLTITFNTILITVQYFHYLILGTYFTISEIFLSKEGISYLYIIPKLIDLKLLIIVFICFLVLI